MSNNDNNNYANLNSELQYPDRSQVGCEKKKREKQHFSLIDIVWLVASILAIFLCLVCQSGALFLVIFQMILVVGLKPIIADIREKKYFDAIYQLPVPILAVLLLVSGLIIAFNDATLPPGYFECAVYGFIVVVIVIGFILIGLTYFRLQHLKEVCVLQVNAKCVKVFYETGSRSSVRFCPVFAFDYRGRVYEVCDNEYDTDRAHTVGSDYTIMVNPENPEEFFDSAVSYVTQYIIGGFYIVGPLVWILKQVFNLNIF